MLACMVFQNIAMLLYRDTMIYVYIYIYCHFEAQLI